MKKLFKQLKCYWCDKPLEILREPCLEDHTYFLECEDYHCSLILNSKGKHIRQYTVLYDSKVGENTIRYKIVANEVGKFTSMYSKKNSGGYTLVATIGYIPPKIEDDRIQIQALIKKLKILSIIS